MAHKVFTLDEALRALPLVKKIAHDIHDSVEQIAAIQGGMALVYGTTKLDSFEEPEKSRLFHLNQQIAAHADELAEIGVELKGLQPVLIDFPSVRAGRSIYLCWAHGESTIQYWHPLAGGFASRERLT